MTSRLTTPTQGALALTPPEPAPCPQFTLLTNETASALIRRAARLTRHDAYTEYPHSPRRAELLESARALDALAANIAAFAGDVARLDFAMRRSIELALTELDEQIAYGTPRANQQVHYRRIFATVRSELAEQEATT